MNILNSHMHKLLALGVCLIPVSAFAQDGGDLSYTYVELDYINLDVDQPGEDEILRDDFDNGGGYGLSGSFALNENFFIYGDYSETEADFGFVDNSGAVIPGDTDVVVFKLGAGFIMPMNDSTDLVFSGGYSDIDFDSFNLGASGEDDLGDLDDDPSDGYTVDVKLRSQLSQALEGSIGARYTDIESVDGFSVIGNLMYEVSQNWGVNLSLDAGDELMVWGVGARYSF